MRCEAELTVFLMEGEERLAGMEDVGGKRRGLPINKVSADTCLDPKSSTGKHGSVRHSNEL